MKKIGLRRQGLKVVDLPAMRFKCPNAETDAPLSGPGNTCICPNLGRCKNSNFELSVYRNIKQNILNFYETMEQCLGRNICPLEMALNAAQEADVIICDYRYIFTEEGEWFIESSRLNYKDSILVVDESHRLPDNIKSSLKITLTADIINGAVQEADERKQKNLVYYLNGLKAILEALSNEVGRGDEVQIERDVLINSFKDLLKRRNYGRLNLEEFLESLQILDAVVRKKKGYTNTYRVLRFLKQWVSPSSPMVAVLRCDENPKLVLSSLDPGLISRDIFSQVHSTVLMSHTLIPPEMYIDILGLPASKLVNRSYDSFNTANVHAFLSDKNITTSNQKRTPDMYSAIASEIEEISKKVPGNIAAFFPSYTVLAQTLEFLEKISPAKRIFVEERGLKRADRKSIEEGLEEAGKTGKGGILLGVQGGYFSDSPEFKRNLFSGILVVGIPFSKPDIEQRANMEYLKSRFGGMKGYYYSQIYPAMSKVVQAMSSGPRKGDAKGVCVLMDYRFKDPKYLKALPPEYQVDVEANVASRLGEIFDTPDGNLDGFGAAWGNDLGP